MNSELCNLLFQHARDRPGEDFWTEFSGERVFLVQSATLAASILKNPDDFSKDMSNMIQVAGHSRLTENGEPWQVLLRASQPVLAGVGTGRVCEAAFNHARFAVEALGRTCAERAPRVDHLVVEETTGRVLSELVFEMDLAVLGPGLTNDVSEFLKYIKINTPYSGSCSRERGAAEFRELGNLRLRWLNRFSDLPQSVRNNRFFKRIRDAVDKPEVSATLEQEVLFLLGAGSETSAATVSWAMLFLADNPSLQSELRAALDEYWTKDDLDFQRLINDRALASVVREVMCLYPAVPMVVRSPNKDVCAANHDMQQGDHIIVSLLGVGHGHLIRPDGKGLALRDLGHARGDLDDLLRFGAGPRKCGGQRMATAEISVILACLLRNFDFARTPDEAVRFSWQLSMTCEGGVPVILSRRPA